jgi:lincosamide nucleotidyltransferase A/C/D/E
MVDGTTQAQLRVIHRVVDVLSAVNVPAWLFGGWGLDARIGRITRSHGDIEFWVPRSVSARSRAALVDAGSTVLAKQPPEEASEFIWDGVSFSTAYFDLRADGTFALQGRWSDWVFPADSFGEEPGLLDGIPVPAMSVAGMLAMKEQFPTLRNGRPWRDKDIGDIAVLRGLRSGPRSAARRNGRTRRRVTRKPRRTGGGITTTPTPRASDHPVSGVSVKEVNYLSFVTLARLAPIVG